MKKYNISFLFFFPLVVLLCTCNDPVFYAISQEVKPIEPRIKGIPTNFVAYNDRMYVASGKTLYSYNKGTEKPYWSYETPPGGNIIQITSTDNYLYALCAPDTNNYERTVIRKYDKTTSSWSTCEYYNNIQNIYSANNTIFFYSTSFKNDDYITYTIFYLDSSDNRKAFKTNKTGNTGELCGVAHDVTSWYLATKRGVYKTDDLNTEADLIEFGGINGIINLQDSNNTIFLITRDGAAYTVKDKITQINDIGGLSNGVLAIWKENEKSSSGRLLLVGRQDALTYTVSYGYRYGYLEIELDSNGIKGSSFSEPGLRSLSTIKGDNDRYRSTLGKEPVNCLFQAPFEIDKDMTLFASTQKNGVWSYRDRDGRLQWNAEGENEP